MRPPSDNPIPSPDSTRTDAPGLRSFGPGDFLDPDTPWTPEMTAKATWAAGHEQAFLPTDLVVRFNRIEGPRCGRGGYALLRGSEIVAEQITWLA